jgi:hypothetical protein
MVASEFGTAEEIVKQKIGQHTSDPARKTGGIYA